MQVSTLRSMISEPGKISEQNKNNKRLQLLSQASSICNWVSLWDVHDAIKHDDKKMPKDLEGFDDYAESVLNDVAKNKKKL